MAPAPALARSFSYFFFTRASLISARSFSDGRGSGRRRRRLGPAHPVRDLDELEEDEGDDQEIDEDGDEAAIGEDGALLLGGGERRRRDVLRQAEEVVVEIEAAGDGADDGHDDVVDERGDDLAEGGADDHADRQVEGVALERERLKLLPHGSSSCCPIRAPQRGGASLASPGNNF